MPTIISPNGDGINDRLIINCLETGKFQQNQLIILNQWGDDVFSASPYQNEWAGTYKGQDLPVGTYYFVFQSGGNAPVQKGFLIIER